MAVKIYRHVIIRATSENSYTWLVKIPIENAYVQIAGAREKNGQKVYEMYSRHGRKSAAHETEDEAVFIAWFQARFGLDPNGAEVAFLPSEVKLTDYTKATKRIYANILQYTQQDFTLTPEKLIPYYNLQA